MSSHRLYLQLGVNDQLRAVAYRDFFITCLNADELSDVRNCLQSGTPLGSGRFKDQIEQVLKV